MGGAVQTAKDIVTVAAAPMYAPVAAVANVAKGDSLGTAVGKSFKPALGVISKTAGDVMGGISDPKPTLGAPAAPAQKSAADLANEQEAARRKALVDLKKDRPGRDATMLADDSAFPYRLV